MAADFRGTGITDRPAPDVVRARRARPRAASRAPPSWRGVPTAGASAIGGVVIVRQRPGTAKGFVFITVEDETGFANAIVTPQRFARAQARDRRDERAGHRRRCVQNQDGVVSIKADRFHALEGHAAAVDISHDFH